MLSLEHVLQFKTPFQLLISPPRRLLLISGVSLFSETA